VRLKPQAITPLCIITLLRRCLASGVRLDAAAQPLQNRGAIVIKIKMRHRSHLFLDDGAIGGAKTTWRGNHLF
jgi:hypothetical protein